MSKFRGDLVRANFEVHRDLIWAEILEPQIREEVASGDELGALHKAWNRHVEERDWAWWQEHAKRLSNAELDGERMDCIERLDQLGMLQWQRQNVASQQFQKILNDSSTADERPRQESRERDEGRER